MFFNISHAPLENYPCHWRMGSFCVSTDQGWHHTTLGTAEILYKGYADSAPLDRLLEQILFQTEPMLTGNFCSLILVDDTIKIQTDRYRSFPIYVGNGVNNLVPTDRTAWTDSLILVHSDLSVSENKFDVIGDIDTTPLSVDAVLDKITTILDQKTESLLKYNHLPVRVFLSGGVDSMLVYSFLKKHSNNYELVKCSHVDYDYFWLKNSGDISKYWGYNQIHYWQDPCVLTSGTPGDEFMLRSPTTSDLWLKAHGIQINDLLKDPKWCSCLHAEYFNRKSNYAIFQEPSTISATPWELSNIIVNDWQHWHLGNTLTWTPLRDLEIFKLILRLPIDTVIEQVMNSSISIQLIERNCPGLSLALSDCKNTGNVLSNLTKVYGL
jgi:hypothetical protein